MFHWLAFSYISFILFLFKALKENWCAAVMVAGWGLLVTGYGEEWKMNSCWTYFKRKWKSSAVRRSAQPGAWSLDCQRDCVALELTWHLYILWHCLRDGLNWMSLHYAHSPGNTHVFYPCKLISYSVTLTVPYFEPYHPKHIPGTHINTILCIKIPFSVKFTWTKFPAWSMPMFPAPYQTRHSVT